MRAPKNITMPPDFAPTARCRRMVKARIGAEPVPVQIIKSRACGSSGIRKVAPNGPVNCTLSPFFRSQT